MERRVKPRVVTFESVFSLDWPRLDWLRSVPPVALGLLLLGAAPALAQHSVTGRVTATGTGEPIEGVQVAVMGTGVGSRTNAEGRYGLTAPSANDSLVFVRIGFARAVVPINGQSVVDVTLSPVARQLEEVVAIGYGEKERATMTESIGTISAQEIARVPIASPEAAIQGRVSGIQVQAESGQPGAPVAVRIRGVGTVGNTQPLFVVDGLPVGRGNDPGSSPLTTLNPNEIESISVLKDASAAAIYGVQAANGVVLITTKHGGAGRPRIEYNGYYGAQYWPQRYDLLDSEQWFALSEEANANYNAQFGYDPATDSRALKFTDWTIANRTRLEGINTDWQDVIANDGAPIMNHHAAVSGGGDRTRYFVSGGYFEQEPIVARYDLRRMNFRANSDFQVRDRLRVGETFTVSYAEINRGQNNNFNGQLLPNALQLPSFFRFRDVDGSVTGNRYGFTGNQDLATNAGLQYTNEPGYNLIVENTDRDYRVLGGLYGEVDIVRGLTFRSQGSLDLGVARDYAFSPNITRAEIGLDRPDNVGESRGENYALLWSNTMNYNTVLGHHTFGLLAGTEVQRARWNGSNFSTTGLITQNEAYRYVPSVGGTLVNPPAGWAGERAFMSYLGRLSYDYAQKYLLTFSLRRDGSSNFAPENRWGTFPAVSAGWRISEEPFFSVPWVSELKLRGSWGKLGNSDVPASYPHIFQVTTTPDYGLNGGTVVKAPVPAGFVNRNLVWETSESMDFGVESGFLDDRLTFSATYYHRDTEDFLINVPLPWSSGFPNGAPINSGLVRNTGLELESGYAFTAPGGVDLRVSGNLTTVENRLVSLRPGVEEYSSGGIYRTSVGRPIDYFYGYKSCGLYRTQAQLDAAPQDKTIGTNELQLGDVCFEDTDSDGDVDADDRTFLGSSIPDFYYGLSLNGTWRRLDLGLFFSGVGGVQKYNRVRQDLETVSGGRNRSTAVLNHWTPETPNAPLPRAVSGDPSQNSRLSDRWVEDADYFRLRNVQLGYTVPEGMLRGAQNTRVYVAATNLFTITPYKGLDPEFTTSIDFIRSQNAVQQQSATDMGTIPQPRTFQFGVSTSF
jgi:TonB-dependent starch-binding outer membrane protein SusC